MGYSRRKENELGSTYLDEISSVLLLSRLEGEYGGNWPFKSSACRPIRAYHTQSDEISSLLPFSRIENKYKCKVAVQNNNPTSKTSVR